MDWTVLNGIKLLLLILVSTGVTSGDGEKRVVCYYTNWSVYRPGTAKFLPENINPYLCTHLIYAFGGFTKDDVLKPFDKYQDVDKGGYAKFTGLKTYNKDLKVLLAIGGWNEGSSRFSPMVADPQRRKKLVKNTVKFLRQNHFDGLDLDWEYPAHRDGGKPRDKDNYASLVQELREEFEKESTKTGKPRLLLTMAVPAGIEYIDKGYDIPKLNEYLDFMNLLSYDYHSAYEPAVNHHSPLYPLEEENEYNYDSELTIDFTIKHLIKSGASSEKIVIGIPTYGRSYTLFNEDANALGSPADGPGVEGDATREKGYLAYYEICESIMKDGWAVEKPNPKAMGPYAYKNNQWVGYDDEDIVRAKAKYVNQKKLGGIMFWSIDNDDFRGKCHGRPYPLIEAAKEALLEDNEKRSENKKSTSTNSRKRNRVSETSKSSSESSDRKSTEKSSNRRNNLSSRSSSGKRPSTSSSKSRSRTNAKTASRQKNDDSNDDDTEDNENVETTKTESKSSRPQEITNKNRFRTRLNSNDRNSRKKQTSEPATTTTTTTTTTPKSQNNKITTPEPPTTPDPGSDFKCEDEGFFPHPRDCKKYFWCLDSGPSGLGIVANQFTCPSGLVFNKLADSCDYPRNVACPKIKAKPATTTTTTTSTTSTTTRRTTTEKERVEELEDEEEEEEEYEEEDVKETEDEKPRKSSTTAKPLQYKTISRTRQTTTTSTAAPSNGSGRSSDDESDDEEDPKVIKELIDLIKKAGGIEQLEKQLALQEKNSGDAQVDGQNTPATISKSLYERVLSRQQGKNNLFGIQTSRLSNRRKNIEPDTVDEKDDDEVEEEEEASTKIKFVNGPGKSQFEGLDQVPEIKGLRRSNKPKYVTIERQSSSTASSRIDDEVNEDEELEEEEEEGEDNEDVASSDKKTVTNNSNDNNYSSQRSTPGYVNIRRSRPTTTAEPSRTENDIKDLSVSSKEEQPVYSTPASRRSSSRTTETKQKEITEQTTTPKTRYISANRFRSTTVTPEKEIEKEVLFSTETPPTKAASTTLDYAETYATDDKTITVAGESGRISITPFTTNSPSTARIYSEDLSSTLKSTNPFFEDKLLSTQSTTKRNFDTTGVTQNPTTLENRVTEPLLTIVPIETTTRETIPAVSQPRPFGYPRRRGTTPSTTISEFSYSTRGVEPTSRPKVNDELIHHSVNVEITTYKPATKFLSELTKKTNILHNSFPNKADNFMEILQENTSSKTDLIQNDIEKVIRVPVRLVDGPADELFFLQIPEHKLNSSKINAILKIEILNASHYGSENVNSLINSGKFKIMNEPTLETESTEKTTAVSQNLYNHPTKFPEENFKNASESNYVEKNNKFVPFILNEAILSNPRIKSDSVNLLKDNNTDVPSKKNYKPVKNLSRNSYNIDKGLIESAIYHVQNSVSNNYQQPLLNKTLNHRNSTSNKNRSPSEKKKVHRQRVLIYRGSAKHQPTNDNSQRKWVMRKVIRKVIRREEKLKMANDWQESVTMPVAEKCDDFVEVSQPGINLLRQPVEDTPIPRIYTAVPTATFSPTSKIYPVQIGIGDNTRVVGILADQSGDPQNLELVLADPPATIASFSSSPSDSGRESFTSRPSFRRKVSSALSPRPTEDISTVTIGSSRIISSEKRRQGTKYSDSERTASQNSYQIYSRPFKPAVSDYDYYEDQEERFTGDSNNKILITNRGYIKCLDQGNFAHPESCKKFISCAKMVNGIIVGTEYTCPKKLSFDPIGGMCNWSAGLGCHDIN